MEVVEALVDVVVVFFAGLDAVVFFVVFFFVSAINFLLYIFYM